MIFRKPKEPSDVFTPRSHEVNNVMYVNRPSHEVALRRAIATKYNLVIFGDSGCGKSWLYKKVFSDDDIYYHVIDFSSCGDADEVDIQMLEAVAQYEEWIETERKDSANMDIKPMRMGGGMNEEATYRKIEVSPFIRLLNAVRVYARRKKAFLVFENLEYALDKVDVISKIQKMLLGLDDPSVGKHNVQICLVGVPSEIKEVLSDGNKFQTISNRVYEVPEVNRLNRKSVDLLVQRGLEQELEYTIESKTFCYSKIAFVTYSVPQYVHDVCLHVALRAQDNLGLVNPAVIDAAVDDWVIANSRQGIEFIRAWIMNDRSRNQSKAKIIFAISRLEKHFFSSADINQEIETHFPLTMNGRRVQTLANLRKLADGEGRILKCDQERQLFRVATPQLRSCLRVCLKKHPETEVIGVRTI